MRYWWLTASSTAAVVVSGALMTICGGRTWAVVLVVVAMALSICFEQLTSQLACEGVN